MLQGQSHKVSMMQYTILIGRKPLLITTTLGRQAIIPLNKTGDDNIIVT